MEQFSFRQKLISFILKGIVIISAIIGTIFSSKAGIGAFMGGQTVFMYFTIQSNLLVALVSLIGIFMILFKKANYVWYVIKFVTTVSITLTGVVFTVVLAPTMGSAAWVFYNVLTHVVVPVCAVIDFFVVGINTEYRKIDVLYVMIPPLLYAVYATIGYVAGWKFTKTQNYPYFFLNWGSKAGAIGFSNELPFMGVIWWIILLLGFLVGIGFLYIFIAKKLRNKFIITE